MKKLHLAVFWLAFLMIVGFASANAQEIAATKINAAAANDLAAPVPTIDAPAFSPSNIPRLVTPSQIIGPGKGLQRTAQCSTMCNGANAGLFYCPGGNWCCPGGYFFCPGNPAGQQCVPGSNPFACNGTKVSCCPTAGNSCTHGC